MAELNPYQRPEADESAAAERSAPFDPASAGIPPETLRVLLGLVLVLGVTLGFVAVSGAFAVIDRFTPVSWFDFSGTIVPVLVGIALIAAAAIGWLVWRLVTRGYPRWKLAVIGAAGWMLGGVMVLGIIRNDAAGEERRAKEICEPLAATPGAARAAEQCMEAALRCRRWLERQPGHARLTFDAERAMMNGCLARSMGASP